MHGYVLRKEMEWGLWYIFQIFGENNSPHSTYLNIFIVNLGGGERLYRFTIYSKFGRGRNEKKTEKGGDTRDWNQELRLTVGIGYSDITQGKVICWVSTSPKLGSTSLPSSNQTFCLLPCPSCLCYTHTLRKALWKKPSMKQIQHTSKNFRSFTGFYWSSMKQIQ